MTMMMMPIDDEKEIFVGLLFCVLFNIIRQFIFYWPRLSFRRQVSIIFRNKYFCLRLFVLEISLSQRIAKTIMIIMMMKQKQRNNSAAKTKRATLKIQKKELKNETNEYKNKTKSFYVLYLEFRFCLLFCFDLCLKLFNCFFHDLLLFFLILFRISI